TARGPARGGACHEDRAEAGGRQWGCGRWGWGRGAGEGEGGGDPRGVRRDGERRGAAAGGYGEWAGGGSRGRERRGDRERGGQSVNDVVGCTEHTEHDRCGHGERGRGAFSFFARANGTFSTI